MNKAAWNHNIHYHRALLRFVPRNCEHALDVGCGDGLFARKLSRIVRHVTAIDIDEASIQLARQQDSGDGVEYILDDFFTYKFDPASFDVIVSVSVLHHMDTAAALERMRYLLRPGGTLAVLACHRMQYPADLPFELAAKIAHKLHTITKAYQEHSAPKCEPRETYAGVRRIAREILPGVRCRRNLLWRYSLIWTKPLNAT